MLLTDRGSGRLSRLEVFNGDRKTKEYRMDLSQALHKYENRKLKSLTASECRELISAYGDLTNELHAGHDPDDAEVWQAVLSDNIGGSPAVI